MRLIESHLLKKGSHYLDYLKKDHMPHSFLFVGASGSLKKASALDFANHIIIQNNLNPLAEKKLRLGQHPDLIQIHLDPKSSFHSISNIKKYMDEITLSPFESKVRVMIIHDADKMLPPAANALLKTLEEPVSNTVFLLLGNSESSFLKTIASRCITISFDLLSRDDIKRQLMETEHLSEQDAALIAKFSFGSLEMAKTLSTKERPYPQELFLDCLRGMDLFDYATFSNKLDVFDKAISKEPILSSLDLFDMLLYWIRDVEKAGVCQSQDNDYFVGEAESLNRQARSRSFSFDEAVEALLAAKRAVSCNVKFRTCFESFYLKFYQNCART